jgi:MFS family permease
MADDPETPSTPAAQPETESKQGYWQMLRLFSPSLRRLLLSIAMTTTVSFGLVAVLQNLFLLRLGFDARFIGLMLGVGQIVWAVTALPAGILSNRIGLRNGILLGLGFFGLGLALMLLVERQPESIWRIWLMGSQGVMNLGVAFISVNVAPYLMVVTGERERRHAFAFLSAIIPATAFLGSLIAGLLPGWAAGWLDLSLDQPAPYRLALWLGPILMLLGLLPLIGIEPARAVIRSRQKAADELAPQGLLAFFGLIVFLQSTGEGAVRAFFNVYLDTRLAVPPAQIGTIMGVAQLLPIAAALSTPLLIGRLGTGYALVVAILGIGVCLLPLAAVPHVGVAALAFMGVIAMVTMTNTSRDLFGQEIVIPRWRTTAQGTAVVGLALGWATAGVMGGYLIETLGFGIIFFTGAVSAVLSALLLVTFLRRWRVPASPEGVAPL